MIQIQNGICCFTGHRSFETVASPTTRALLYTMINNLIKYGYTTFVAGGALGFDTAAAEYILRCRAQGLPVRLHLVLPCRDQAARWSLSQKRRYEAVLAAADQVEYVSENYTPDCMHRRNRRMVELSSACVAFCNRKTGGTAYTLEYARGKGLGIYNIADMQARLGE